VERSPVNSAGQHDPGVPVTSGRVAPPHLASGFILQERKEGHLPGGMAIKLFFFVTDGGQE